MSNRSCNTALSPPIYLWSNHKPGILKNKSSNHVLKHLKVISILVVFFQFSDNDGWVLLVQNF